MAFESWEGPGLLRLPTAVAVERICTVYMMESISLYLFVGKLVGEFSVWVCLGAFVIMGSMLLVLVLVLLSMRVSLCCVFGSVCWFLCIFCVCL